MSIRQNSINPVIELLMLSTTAVSGILSISAIGLPGGADVIANPQAQQVACRLTRNTAAPAYGLIGLASLGCSAIALKRLQAALTETEAETEVTSQAQSAVEGTATAALPQSQRTEANFGASLGKQPLPIPVHAMSGDRNGGKVHLQEPPNQAPLQPRDVVGSIAKSRNCLMLIAAPGSGKTTLVCAVEHELFSMVPQATWVAVVQKAEKSSFGGIKEQCPGAVVVATNKDNVYNPRFHLEPTKPGIVNLIDRVYAEFERRSQIEDERAMKKLPPLVLYLGDYPSLVSILGSYMNPCPEDFEYEDDEDKPLHANPNWRKALIQDSFDKLFLMVTNARATGVRVLFDGQDFNVGSLVPKGVRANISKNLRECMGGVGLGLISTNPNTGEQEGSYGVLDNFMQANNSPLNISDRARLGEEYVQWKAQSMEQQRPLCVSTAGGAAEMSILPDLRGIADQRLPAYVLIEHADRVHRLLEGKPLAMPTVTGGKVIHQIPRRDELMRAIIEGMNQADAIREVYGVSAGGSPQYKEFAQHYNELKTQLDKGA
jgi:hypothetical protein